MRGNNRRSTATACAVTVFVVAACSGQSDAPKPMPDRVVELTTNSQVLFVHTTPPTGGMDSVLLGGTLSMADSCLGVQSDSQSFHVVVFPYGTEWASPTSIRVGEREVELGDIVDLSGGMSATDELADRVSDRCPAASEEIFDAGKLDLA